MSSRKEEERNEKIIRGLMKLPPNRRCINCNSLGPQYVCTNFWTFVCMTCSGIHREFTHRVKSVSMAKFTSQEVEALQKGGNQRARETYLTAWDPQRQRLPDNSNVDKVREFIKNVYADKKYALEKSSDRPPRYAQNAKGQEDETRRASSYHSYSQSPPYDYQYEERVYGKPAPGLTRKPGSDRGLYGGKLSSFLSPGHSTDHIHEDRFANEGSNPRASDYSASNGGYPLGSGGLSPSSQKDVGSPFSATSRDSTREVALRPTVSDHADTYTRRDGGRLLHPQRTSSSGSFGSFDSNSMSFASVNSFNLLEIASEPEQSAETSQRKLSSMPSQPQGSAPASFNGLDLFSAPFVPQNVMSASPPAGVIQFPEASSAQPVDLFQQSSIPSVPTSISRQSSQTLPSSLDLFAEMPQEQSSTGSNGKIPEAMSKNEGWATFDIPQRTSSTGIENPTHAVIPSSDKSFLGKEDSLSLVHKPSLQGSSDHRPSADMSTLWHEGAKNFESTLKTTSTQSWNAFQDTEGEQSMENTLKSSESVASLHASDANQYLGFNTYETLGNDLFQRAAETSGPPLSSLSSHSSVLSHDFHTLPAVDGVHSNAKSQKSVNPFDLPDDYGVESSNMPQFWDMSSLQSALPSSSLPASFVGGMNQQSWFPQNPVTSYVPGGLPFDPAIGSLGFIAGQAPGNQIPNVPAQGPVASIGGNPFA